MGFLTVIFTIAGVGVAIGLGIGLIVTVPTLIYSIPYALWFGWNSGTNNIPKKSSGNLFHQAKNATKLYRSWITKQPHNITNW